MTLNSLYSFIKSEISRISDCASFEASVLLEKFYSLKREDVILNPETEVDEGLVLPAVEKRLEGYPLQYIVGEWEFMGNVFKVNEHTLIPRPETEILCSCLDDEISNNPGCVVADLCAGTGCVGISIAKRHSDCKVVLVEKYPRTFDVLSENIKRCGVNNVRAVCADITEENFDMEPCDIILSNPPYIKRSQMKDLQKEVLFEPREALEAGEDGLTFYRAIRDNCLRLLKPGGYCAFECADDQAQYLKEIFSGLEFVKTVKDYSGCDRVVVFKKV